MLSLSRALTFNFYLIPVFYSYNKGKKCLIDSTKSVFECFYYEGARTTIADINDDNVGTFAIHHTRLTVVILLF